MFVQPFLQKVFPESPHLCSGHGLLLRRPFCALDQQGVVARLAQAQQLPEHPDVVLAHAAVLLLQALQ